MPVAIEGWLFFWRQFVIGELFEPACSRLIVRVEAMMQFSFFIAIRAEDIDAVNPTRSSGDVLRNLVKALVDQERVQFPIAQVIGVMEKSLACRQCVNDFPELR